MLKHAELVHFKTPTVKPMPFDFSGHWVNELGSYVDLKVDGAAVAGKYVSLVTEDGAGPTRHSISMAVSLVTSLTSTSIGARRSPRGLVTA